MFKRLIVVVVLLMLMSQTSSGIILEDFGVQEGDEFGFLSENSLFREYSNGGIVNDQNGFVIYGVFIEEFHPFTFNIADIADLEFVNLELEVDDESHLIQDKKEFFVHDTDWEAYFNELKALKDDFDGRVDAGEIIGDFTIINSETEIGYEVESHEFTQLEGNDYYNETVEERVRFQKSTGVIWEHYNNTRAETSTNLAQIRDIYFYSFHRDVDFVSETSAKVIIPGYTFTIVMISLGLLVFSLSKFRHRANKYNI